MSSKAVRLPPKLEFELDVAVPVATQIDALFERYRSSYVWFEALPPRARERLKARLVENCSHYIAQALEALGRLQEIDEALGMGSTPVTGLERIPITFTMDELQDLCAELLPLADLNALLLASLDLNHIFGDSYETQRQATYSQLVLAKYRRTDAISAIDPAGKKFCIDLADMLDDRQARELNFTAVGCHGTLTAAFSRLEGKGQFLSVLARKVVGQQRNVGNAIMRWHADKKKARTRSFGFLLGDNFYESGVPKTDIPVVDEMFKEGYYRVYNELDRKPLGIPYFGLLGNHDYNFHGHAVVPSASSAFAENMDRAIAEVDYGYRVGNHWHMPYRYYLLVSPVADFFVIDTSTFLFDQKQQEWLKAMYGRLSTNGKWKFLMAHHGFVTFGQRGAGHHAEGDLGKLAKTRFTKYASSELARGKTGATEEQMAGAAALGLQDNVNRHILSWFIQEQLHFHVNVVAHDHFSAAALLTYDFPDGSWRRTYYVLAGGGGAALSGGNLDTLVRLGPNLANIDLLEKKHGFATFKVTSSQVSLNFRLMNGSHWEDGWDEPLLLDLTKPGFWTVPVLDTTSKARANPSLRGVFYKRGAGGVFHSSAFQRRYFEITWGSPTFRYGEKPGKLVHSVDLRQLDPASRSWLSGSAKVGAVKGVPDLWHLTFKTKTPARTWEFAAPEQVYHDICAWINSAISSEAREE